jgi:cysteine desulfurase
MSHNENSKRIYLDNSASTAVDERVLEAMNPYWREYMGNAGSLHLEGRTAKQAIENARTKVAEALHTLSETIIFTSGGTESNNLAVFGVIRERIKAGKKPEELHIITSLVEHNSVYDCFQVLEREGVRVTYIPVDTEGRIVLRELEEAITKDTVLVSFLYVNNEIGTIENLKDIAHVVRNARKNNTTGNYPLFHTDASQAFVWLHIDVQKLGIDFLTLDSQKIYGPKGMGCLYVRHRATLEPLMYGGGQEFGLRPGTPPTPLIVGFSKALSIVEEERETYVKEVAVLRDWLREYVFDRIPHVSIHGPVGEGRVAGNISFSFPNIEGEQLVIELDTHNIATSTKSACLSQESNESRVICALMKENNTSNGTLRITLSRFTTREEVEIAAETLVKTVEWLQKTH